MITKKIFFEIRNLPNFWLRMAIFDFWNENFGQRNEILVKKEYYNFGLKLTKYGKALT